MRRFYRQILCCSVALILVSQKTYAGDLYWIKKRVPSLTWLSAMTVARSINRSPFLTNSSVPATIIEQCAGKVPDNLMPLLARAFRRILAEEPRIVFENVRADLIKSMLCHVEPRGNRAMRYMLMACQKEEGCCWGDLFNKVCSPYYKISFTLDGVDKKCFSHGPLLVSRGSVLTLWREANTLFLVRSLAIYNHLKNPFLVQIFGRYSFLKRKGKIYGSCDDRTIESNNYDSYRVLIPYSYLERAQRKFIPFLRLKIIVSYEDAKSSRQRVYDHLMCSSSLVPLGHEELAVHVWNFNEGIRVGNIM